MNHLKDFRPSGDSVAARLRSTPAELLLAWEGALVELREQYREGYKEFLLCPLCSMVDQFKLMQVSSGPCNFCPWVTFEGTGCGMATPPYDNRSPTRRISEIGRWLKRIRAEIRARGI